MVEVRILGVSPAGCTDHVRVMLHATEPDRYLRVMIDGEAGRAILSELNGLGSIPGRMTDALLSALAASGANVTSLEMTCEGESLHASVFLETFTGSASLSIDPCAALLLAARNKVPLFVPEPPPFGQEQASETEVPEAFRSFLESLEGLP